MRGTIPPPIPETPDRQVRGFSFFAPRPAIDAGGACSDETGSSASILCPDHQWTVSRHSHFRDERFKPGASRESDNSHPCFAPTSSLRQRVVAHAEEFDGIESRRAAISRKLGRLDEFRVLVCAARNRFRNVFRAENSELNSFHVSIDRRKEDVTSGSDQSRTSRHRARGIGHRAPAFPCR